MVRRYSYLWMLQLKGCLVATFDTPPCAVLIALKGDILHRVILESDPEDRQLLLDVPDKLDRPRGGAGRSLFVAEQIQRHLFGEGIPDYSNVVLDPAIGTVFRRRVWEVARTVPYGETRSYKWLAGQAGSPRAYRAAGSTMAENPFPLVVPCHRIIASDGSLGGFGGGLDLKKALLALEQAVKSTQSTTSRPIKTG